MELQTQQCPWCGSVISHQKFLEIESRIRAEEQRRLAESEKTLRKQLSQEKEAAEQKYKNEAAQLVATATAERDAASKKLRDAEVRESLIRTQVREETLSAVEEQKQRELADQRSAFQAELNQLRSNLEDADARAAAIRTEAQAEAAATVQADLESERKKHKELQGKILAFQAERETFQSQLAEAQARVETVQSEASNLAEQRANAVIQEAEQQKQHELKDLRLILEADRDQAVLKAQVGFSREKEDLEKKLLEVQHELKKTRANEIGEGAEVNLFESLRAAFEEDNITRVRKGQPGPDIVHEVRHNGLTCGTIIYDSKHRQDWKEVYATKLQQDQLNAGALHALLTTTFFPSAEKELCLRSGVIVVNPARAVYIVQLLREQMVAMHVRGLSLKAKTQKTERLYALMTSATFMQKFQQAVQMIEQMLQIEAEEKDAHDKIWRKRGILLKRQSAALKGLDTEINAIIEGDEETQLPAA